MIFQTYSPSKDAETLSEPKELIGIVKNDRDLRKQKEKVN
jgi:hypothetical protein